mmetsp:Transcript_8658/g.13063  ORF Transcript_8658/g.13063 Transcript_8658/m.13063 type:complete len:84 (+) Transcript_8658:31-282(+)
MNFRPTRPAPQCNYRHEHPLLYPGQVLILSKPKPTLHEHGEEFLLEHRAGVDREARLMECLTGCGVSELFRAELATHQLRQAW